MKILTAKQMRELDRAAIERHGISSLDLMERAGAGVAAVALEYAAGDGPIAVLCGSGNNGGDGFVAARHLRDRGREVIVLLAADPSRTSPDSAHNRTLFERAGGTVIDAAGESSLAAAMERCLGASLLIDALLGTGLEREVSGTAARAIELMNQSHAPVLACDLPSGLDSDTGMPRGCAVKVAATATLGLPKIGLYTGKGPELAGRVRVVDIGIPAEEIARVDSRLELAEPSMFGALLAPRGAATHKGSCGHVVIFAGFGGHLGAGYLASLGALRAGCGLCTYCLPEAAFARFDARYPEIMCDPIPDGGRGFFSPEGLPTAMKSLEKKSVLALGPAVGTAAETREFVNMLLAGSELPAVVDADALNVLDLEGLAERAAPCVLTPHPGEMARLTGTGTKDVQADRIGSASTLAQGSGAVVVLKGQGTVTASPDGSVAINPTGNPGMAGAGMGDVLTGVIASLIAQGADARTASIAGVYLHGLAGDIAAGELGEASVIASDVIDRLGRAMMQAVISETVISNR